MNYRQKQAAYKLAQTRMAINYVARQRAMQKQADTLGTTIRGGIPSTYLAPLYLPANLVGDVVGLNSTSDNLKDIMEDEKSYGYELLPGVAAKNLNKKLTIAENLLKTNKNKSNKTLSEYLGNLTAPLTATAGGAALGGLIGAPIGGPVGAGVGSLIGGLGGLGASGLAHIGAVLGSNLTKGRNEKDLQEYYDNGSAAANYLIPGVAPYNRVKNLMAVDRMVNKYRYNPEFRKEMDSKRQPNNDED